MCEEQYIIWIAKFEFGMKYVIGKENMTNNAVNTLIYKVVLCKNIFYYNGLSVYDFVELSLRNILDQSSKKSSASKMEELSLPRFLSGA